MKPDVERQAAEWLARLDASDRADVRAHAVAWRTADPAHEAAWLRLSSAWERLDRLSAALERLKLGHSIACCRRATIA